MDQLILDDINLLRSNPPAYAEGLKPLRAYYNGTLYQPPGQVALRTKEGVVAFDEAINALLATTSMPPLTWSNGLTKAALDHVLDTGPKGLTGHTGSDGSTMTSRIQRYGTFPQGGTWAENITYGSSTPQDIVRSWLIDDGVTSRGHRKNLLNPQLTQIGIANGPHSLYKILCVIDLARGFQENSL